MSAQQHDTFIVAKLYFYYMYIYIYISGAAEGSISSISLILYFNQMRLFP